MRILISPDKFKGSLDAVAAASAIAEGFQKGYPEAILDICPIADGGEGTTQSLHKALGGEMITCQAHDPLLRLKKVSYARLDDVTAVMEMSAASGFLLIQPEERDPLKSSTRGTGEMIRHAWENGVQKIYLGIGGSATNDAGAGMASALGYVFLDDKGHPLDPIPKNFPAICSIQQPILPSWPKITVLCDVNNPLCGINGATRVFGKQKGIPEEQFDIVDRWIEAFADIASRELDVDFRQVPGAGAAGGLGYGLMTFLSAKLEEGFPVISHMLRLEERIRTADVVITGEGKLDSQSLCGKGPVAIGRLAKKAGKQVLGIAGIAETEAEKEFDRVWTLANGDTPVELAIRYASDYLTCRAEEAALWLRGQSRVS